MTRQPQAWRTSNVAQLTFLQWCEEIRRLSAANPERYGLDVIEMRGAECWRSYYDDGYSPEEAWQEDGSYY